MADQLLIRDFTLPAPLFSSDSPWRTKAVTAEPQSMAAALHGVYAMLLEFELGKEFKLKDKLEHPLKLSEELKATYAKIEEIAQSEPMPSIGPQFNCQQYTIPLFAASRQEDTFDCPMRSYDGFCCTQSQIFCHPTTFDESKDFMWQFNKDCNACPSDRQQLVIKNLPRPVEVRPGEAVRPSEPNDLGSDGSCVLIDQESNLAYDFWQATVAFDENDEPLGGGEVRSSILQAGGFARFSLIESGTQILKKPNRGRSARATGLPLLGGLLLPEDLANGKNSVIDHAFAFALPRARVGATSPEKFPDFVYPASNFEDSGSIPTPNLLCAGQRLILNEEVYDSRGNEIKWQDSNAVPPLIHIIFQALRDYGAFLVDGSSGFSFYAEDYHTANWNLSAGQEPTDIAEQANESVADLLFLSSEKPVNFPESFPDNWPGLGKCEKRLLTPWHLLMLGLDDLLTWRIGHYTLTGNTASLPFAVQVNGQLHFNFLLAEDLPWPE